MSTTSITNAPSTSDIVLRPQVDYLKMRRARQDAMLQKALPITPLVADVIARCYKLYAPLSETINVINGTNQAEPTITKAVKTEQTMQVMQTELSRYKHDAAVRSNVEKMRTFLQ